MDYTLPVPNDDRQSLIRSWFILAVSALGLSGIFSLAPALLRGPFFQHYMDTQHVFDVALVLHVNLSVLVWILTLASMLWSFSLPIHFVKLGRVLFGLAVLGTLLMTLAPFVGNPIAVKSNYIPVLLNTPFILGLYLFLCVIFYNSIRYLHHISLSHPMLFGLYISAITFVLAVLCFTLSAFLSDPIGSLAPEEFYNLLFWGGGHVLQFTYCNLMIVAWLWLASIGGIKFKISKHILCLLFGFNLLFVLPTPLVFFFIPDLTESMGFFTWHMRIFAGIIPTIIGIILLYSWNKRDRLHLKCPSYIYSTLLFSIVFFAYGGILGLFIRQMNTIVPAHYHASVVGGLTIAFMGLCYHFLPLLGYRPAQGRLPIIQPYIYSIGHLLHISGLAVMGGYGALRKTAADTSTVNTLLGKLMFFTGSPLALIGGLLFIIIMLRALSNPLQK